MALFRQCLHSTLGSHIPGTLLSYIFNTSPTSLELSHSHLPKVLLNVLARPFLPCESLNGPHPHAQPPPPCFHHPHFYLPSTHKWDTTATHVYTTFHKGSLGHQCLNPLANKWSHNNELRRAYKGHQSNVCAHCTPICHCSPPSWAFPEPTHSFPIE